MNKLDHRMNNTTGGRIKAILDGALAPVSLDVFDESHLHVGHVHSARLHGAARTSGGTHYRIRIVSEAFKGKTRIERHRIVNRILQAEFGTGLHALAIEAKAPGE
jgi:BolA family transcriptional regulator, general stress-responsive regulator